MRRAIAGAAMIEAPPPCPLVQSQTYANGWTTEDVWYEETTVFRHLVPCGDTRLHQLDPSCWCSPTEDDEAPDFYVHHAADQRELFEQGIRKPN